MDNTNIHISLICLNVIITIITILVHLYINDRYEQAVGEILRDRVRELNKLLNKQKE